MNPLGALISTVLIGAVVVAVGAWAFWRVCLIVGRWAASKVGGPRF
jgi:hypothetical protein